MAKQYNAQAIAQLWGQRMAAAGERMKAGINAVTENPAEKAAAAAPKYLAGVQRAMAEGKYEAGLRKVTLQGWKTKMLNKGISNMQTGAREAVPDMQAFLTDFLPFAAQVSDQVKAMPSGTKEDSRARMLANFEAMSNYRKRT